MVTIFIVLALLAPAGASGTAETSPALLVLAGLQDPDPLVRVAAARKLSHLAVDLWTTRFDEVMPVVLRALDDPEAEVRRMAAVSIFQATWVIWGDLEVPPEKEEVLEEASPKLRQIHPILSSHLDDPDPMVREYLLRALGTWMPELPGEAVGVAVRAIDDESAAVGRIALLVLGRAGNPTPEVTSRILRVFEVRPALRVNAANVLGELFDTRSAVGHGTAPAAVISALLEAAGDEDEVVRLAVIEALTRVGGRSEEVRSRLQASADDAFESPRVRTAARLGLRRLAAEVAR